MTHGSIVEYAAAVRPRYLKASKREKKRILDEFCQVTGYHRKSAVRLLRHPPKASAKRRGRPKKYGPDLVPPLKVAWESIDRCCSTRLAPFLPELIPILERHKELKLSEAMRAKLVTVSASTIDRLLAPFRRRMGRRSPGTTRSVSTLKGLIPIRTYAQRKPTEVGHIEVDLVAHCGTSTEGFYVNTLVAVDLVSGWTECVPVWGKGQSRVGSAVDQVRREVPFRLLGLNSDNGSEFINHALWDYCQRHDIQFTRSRAYKKNDQAHVEQKNWYVVRRFVGYDRYGTKEAYEQLRHLYQQVRLYVNFFQPISKIIGKRREGVKVRKQYDRAQTPYQRLRATTALSQSQRDGLAALYEYLNPLQLRQQIDQELASLWKMSQPDPRAEAEAAALAKLEASLNNPNNLTKDTKTTSSVR
jgi:hypothetical protein